MLIRWVNGDVMVRLARLRDIAEALGCSVRTVQRMRARGGLPPSLETKGQPRWLASVMEAWLEGRRVR